MHDSPFTAKLHLCFLQVYVLQGKTWLVEDFATLGSLISWIWTALLIYTYPIQ